jgi:Tat protein secretion system quality control protein TatD with DNase activity
VNPSRRKFLKHGIVAAGAVALGAAGLLDSEPARGLAIPTSNGTEQVESSSEITYQFIDAHNHLPNGLTLDDLISRMDSTGVDKTLLMPVFYGEGQGITDEGLVIRWYQQQPNRIVPFFGMQRSIIGTPGKARWEKPDNVAEDLLRLMDSELGSKPYKGIGEFIIRHYPYQLPAGQQGTNVDLPIDSPLMRRFLDVAAKYKLPITIHYEADEKTVPPLKTILEYRPEVTFIWAHCTGRCSPDISRTLLSQYPNLYSDLGGMTSDSLYGHVSGIVGGQQPKNPIEDGQGHLRSDWNAVFEDFPDRFMLGTDLAHPEAWQGKYYSNVIPKWKSLMKDLSNSTATKISYENPMRILNL